MFRRLKQIADWANAHKLFVAAIVTAIFVLVHIPLVLTHEAWDDEAISWLLSEKITPTNIYEVNAVEPHPLLWQIILAPFSKLGFPLITASFISLFFVAVAVFLFFRYAPFGYPTKILFLLSSCFFYFLPVIARDYSLIPLAVCLVCLAYKNRHKKPLLYGLALAFMLQTHILMYGIVGLLSLGFIVEEIKTKKNKKQKLSNIATALIPEILSFITVVPVIIGTLIEHGVVTQSFTMSIFQNFSGLMSTIIGETVGLYHQVMLPAVAVIFIVLILSLISNSIKYTFYGIGSILFFLVSFSIIYANLAVFPQKFATLLLAMLLVLWISNLEPEKRESRIAKFLNKIETLKFLNSNLKKPFFHYVLALLILFSIPSCFYNAYRDLDGHFYASNNSSINVKRYEKGSLFIVGDIVGHRVFNPATRASLGKDYTEYDILEDVFYDDLKYLKYDQDALKRQNFNEATSDQIAAAIARFYDKYDHIYFIYSTRVNCSGEPTVLESVEKYELVEQNPNLSVHKIK
jgi:hypothetical protein